MAEREDCYTWAYTMEVFGRRLKEMTDPAHLITDEDKKEIGELFKHLKTSLRAAEEKCRPLVKS